MLLKVIVEELLGITSKVEVEVEDAVVTTGSKEEAKVVVVIMVQNQNAPQ